jgi:hypothetical protein
VPSSAAYRGCGLPLTTFWPYLRHRYPSSRISTSLVVCTTTLGSRIVLGAVAASFEASFLFLATRTATVRKTKTLAAASTQSGEGRVCTFALSRVRRRRHPRWRACCRLRRHCPTRPMAHRVRLVRRPGTPSTHPRACRRCCRRREGSCPRADARRPRPCGEWAGAWGGCGRPCTRSPSPGRRGSAPPSSSWGSSVACTCSSCGGTRCPSLASARTSASCSHPPTACP